MKTILLLAAVCTFISIGSIAWADQPYPFVESISMPGIDQEGISLLILPDGSGPALTQARAVGSGVLTDATIIVRLITLGGNPIPNFPHEDVWLETDNDQQYFCPGGSCADGPSTVYGEMTFSGALTGGGHHLGETHVFVNGSPAFDPSYYPSYWVHPPVPLSFNSPDINGDGIIDLVDVGYFATDYFNTYDYRSDFVCDGVVNLGDLGVMASGLGLFCQ